MASAAKRTHLYDNVEALVHCAVPLLQLRLPLVKVVADAVLAPE